MANVESGKFFKSESYRPFSFNETRDHETGLTLVTLSYEAREDPRRSLQISVAPEYGSNIVAFRVGGEEIFFRNSRKLN